MWDEISQMTDICHKCTKNGIFKFDKKNKIVLPPKPPLVQPFQQIPFEGSPSPSNNFKWCKLYV